MGYHPRSMRRAIPVIIIVVGLLALVVDFWPNLTLPNLADPAGGDRPIETKLGLDLEGGVRVVYEALPAGGRTPTNSDMQVIRDIMEQRVNATGVSEPVVVTQGTDRVVVEVPGVADVDAVRGLVGQTGRVDFVPIPADAPVAVDGQPLDLAVYPPLFSGDQVASAALGTDQVGRRAVDFTLQGEGSSLFADYTTNNVGRQFAIVLDGTVVSAPVIRSAITNGQGQITGGDTGFSRQEANNLVAVLNYGSLPVPVQELQSETVSPTLGDAFLQGAILAGLIGIGLVLAFMLIYYRLPGVVAGGALIYYAIVVFAIFRLIPVTLTLAGIAGFILSVGMAVDANILIFERMKEELRVGKSLNAAIEAGFSRAWNSIFDSNVSSLITAFILFWFGTSVIRGFALVLIIGVSISMFTAITVSRTVLRFMVTRSWARKPWLYGISDQEFLAARPAGRPARGSARGRV
jgi:preprotein translocase subunit SecD